MESQVTRAPVVLIVEPDAERARSIYRSLRRVRVPRPYHVRSVDQAREWIAEAHPDLCVLPDTSYAVALSPDLRDVAIIILAATNAELASPPSHPAGIDVMPPGHGAIEALAIRVRQMLMWIEANQAPADMSFQMTRTTTQLKLPYSQRLRAIGRQLDREGAKRADLLEVPGGFVVRVYGDDAGAEPLIRDYREGDIPWLLEQAEESRYELVWRRAIDELRPEGQEAALRAMGFQLDRLVTGGVTISDLGDRLLVRSVSVTEGPISLSLGPDAIISLMHEAANQRAK